MKGKASLNLIEANFLNKYTKKIENMEKQMEKKKNKFDPKKKDWINEYIGFHPNNSSKKKVLNDMGMP